MPLILSSNVIWHAYWSIAETKIFRLGVSVICPLYVKKEEWIGKKMKLQKDKIYYFKYRECWSIVTINIHIFENSIQINITFTFIVYGYTSYYPIRYIHRQIRQHTHDYLTNSIRNVSVATDEGPSPKLTLSEGGSKGNIES